MEQVFVVENIACEGCANAIRNGLAGEPGLQTVAVEVASGTVRVEGQTDRARLAARLAELGFPEKP